MNYNQYEIYHETKQHTLPDFPYNTYLCSIPLDFDHVSMHWHEEVEIISIKKGYGIVHVDLVRLEVKAGDFIFILPGQLHSIEQNQNFVMEYENIIFNTDVLNTNDMCSINFLRPVFDGETNFPILIDGEKSYYESIYRSIENLDDLCNRRPFGYQLAVKGTLFQIFFTLITNSDSISHKIKKNKSLDKMKIILSYIQENYSKQITIEEISGVCYYSKSHFMKFFKASTGQGFVQYLNDYRLNIAAQMLSSTSDNIIDIALKTGFENLSYFNRVFKKKYGTSPSQYRNISFL